MTPDRERRYIAEIETLQEDNRQLKAMLYGLNRLTELTKLIDAFGASPGEAKMLLALYRASGKTVNKEVLLKAADGGEDVELKGVDVRICKLRAKIGKKSIITVWGQGYHLTAEAQLKVRAALAVEEDRDTRI